MAANPENAALPAEPANDHDPFAEYRADGRTRSAFDCPHCGHIVKRRSSQKVTPLVSDIYYQCSHPACGHTFKAQISYLYGIVPSAVPNPEFADLPMRPMARDAVVKRDPPPQDDPNQPRFF